VGGTKRGGLQAVLVPLGVFSLKRSTEGAIAVPFRVLSQKNTTGDNVLCKHWYLLEEKKISSHAHKTRSWYFLRVLFKIADEHPILFTWKCPLPRTPVCQLS